MERLPLKVWARILVVLTLSLLIKPLDVSGNIPPWHPYALIAALFGLIPGLDGDAVLSLLGMLGMFSYAFQVCLPGLLYLMLHERMTWAGFIKMAMLSFLSLNPQLLGFMLFDNKLALVALVIVVWGAAMAPFAPLPFQLASAAAAPLRESWSAFKARPFHWLGTVYAGLAGYAAIFWVLGALIAPPDHAGNIRSLARWTTLQGLHCLLYFPAAYFYDRCCQAALSKPGVVV